MEILPRIQRPHDVKNLTYAECSELAGELRKEIIDTVSLQGGHLASNLGVVELTIALHRVFDSPKDRIIFDVGHQIYAHKLLTGRAKQFHTLRSYGGISGFPNPDESEHDLFVTGHSSTSISMALGMARARDLKKEDYHVVAVVGDGALTGGMCYEAMNDAGNGHTRLIVILNDNAMSISHNVGALSNYFKHLRASASWYGNKKRIRSRLENIPLVGRPLARGIEKAKNMVKSVTTGGEMFEALGFRYLGPFDGHNIEEMSHVLEQAKLIEDTPVLIHMITTKGNGYDLAECQPERFHGTAPFFVENGMNRTEKASRSSASVVGETLCALAAEDKRVVAITAAMAAGTGLSKFAGYFPDRFFDVGIAEQHAVSFAAGLARNGMRPYFAVYATFLQRAYDQIIHDVCMQKLPVCILADHAGLVGNDGKTHHGVFLSSMLLSIPELTVLVPRDCQELTEAVKLSCSSEGPVVIAYEKDTSEPFAESRDGKRIRAGQWQLLRDGTDCYLLACGQMTSIIIEAAQILEARGISAGVVDCCSLKPMDLDMLCEISESGLPFITIEEEQVISGWGSEISRICIERHWNGPAAVWGIGDGFVQHGSVKKLLAECKMDCDHIVYRVTEFLEARRDVG